MIVTVEAYADKGKIFLYLGHGLLHRQFSPVTTDYVSAPGYWYWDGYYTYTQHDNVLCLIDRESRSVHDTPLLKGLRSKRRPSVSPQILRPVKVIVSCKCDGAVLNIT